MCGLCSVCDVGGLMMVRPVIEWKELLVCLFVLALGFWYQFGGG